MNILPLDQDCRVNGIAGRIVAAAGDGAEYFVRLVTGPAVWVDRADVIVTGDAGGQLELLPVDPPEVLAPPDIPWLSTKEIFE